MAALSRARYFGYVMTVPFMIPGIVDVASRGGSAWLGDRAHESALVLSVGTVAIFVAREIFAARNHWSNRKLTAQGWLAPPAPGEDHRDGKVARTGDCLASTALLGGTFILEDGGAKHGDAGILRYVPATPRPHDKAPAGFAVLLSLTLGYSLFAQTGRALLLLGGVSMVACLAACSALPAVRKWAPHLGEVAWVGLCVAESAR